MNLSKRLDFVYQFIIKNRFTTVHDVGTDHGKLAVKLLQNDFRREVWATDVSTEAISKLKIKSEKERLNINCLVANGLIDINKPFDVVVVAGLGQNKISNILTKDHRSIINYVLQSQDNPTLIRSWIKENSFFLSDEKIIKEKKHYYHYLFVNKKKGVAIQNQTDITFGPILLSKKDDDFLQFWKERKKRQLQISQKTNNPNKKIRLNEEVKLIEKLLKI